MERSTVDDLSHIQEICPPLERVVGLQGRKMYARADLSLNTYTVCTPVREGDALTRSDLRRARFLEDVI
jgi:hypothetical protein